MLRVSWCPMAEISCCRAGRWRAGFEGWEKRWPSPRWKDAAFDTFWTVFLVVSAEVCLNVKLGFCQPWTFGVLPLQKRIRRGLESLVKGYKYTFWQAWCLAVRKWAQVFPTIRRQPGFSTADNLSTTWGSLYLALSALFCDCSPVGQDYAMACGLWIGVLYIYIYSRTLSFLWVWDTMSRSVQMKQSTEHMVCTLFATQCKLERL